MPTKEPDKVQREIEELLEKLDTFVPEERLAAKIRNRRREKQRDPNAPPSAFQQFKKRVSRITLGQIMIAGLVCLGISFLFRGPLGNWASWVTIAGLLLTGGAFIVSVINGGSSRATLGGQVQRRWRGQIIEYSEPGRLERVRDWFRRKGRR